MATLSSALNYALSGLSVSATRSALVSRNVSFSGDENYSRKSAEIITLPGGAASVHGYTRSMDKRLLDKLLSATSEAADKQTLLDSLSRLGETVGDPQLETSLPSRLGQLQQSLMVLETNPANAALASSVVQSAVVLSDKINAVSDEINDIRNLADQQVSESVDRINALLGQFKIVNDFVVRGSGSTADLTDSLDQRDSILKQLSEELGIRTTTRANNDIAIFATGGAVLFEGDARGVTFAATSPLIAGSTGNAVYIDGAPVTGSGAAMPMTTGKLAALTALRDQSTSILQTQVDEVAGRLIRLFAESDQTIPASLPDVAGLFIDKAGGSVPVAGIAVAGLGSRIVVNPFADPGQGGNPLLIRDGGFGGPAYIYNGGGDTGFQDRIGRLIVEFDLPGTFDPAAGLGSGISLKAFSVNSVAWIESRRQEAHDAASSSSASIVRASETLLKITGVNIDEEMASLLDLERTYQASSKIISVVDSMLASLFEAVR
jgi:flagellar hook-associated protein 1 FlgK